MSAMALNTDLNAAAEYPSTLGRSAEGMPPTMTQKEFARRLNAYMRRKGMGKLTLGGGPAREMKKEEGRMQKPQRGLVAVINDVWGML